MNFTDQSSRILVSKLIVHLLVEYVFLVGLVFKLLEADSLYFNLSFS